MRRSELGCCDVVSARREGGEKSWICCSQISSIISIASSIEASSSDEISSSSSKVNGGTLKCSLMGGSGGKTSGGVHLPNNSAPEISALFLLAFLELSKLDERVPSRFHLTTNSSSVAPEVTPSDSVSVSFSPVFAGFAADLMDERMFLEESRMDDSFSISSREMLPLSAAQRTTLPSSFTIAVDLDARKLSNFDAEGERGRGCSSGGFRSGRTRLCPDPSSQAFFLTFLQYDLISSLFSSGT